MKKVLLLPMMLMGVALSFTSCGDNDDPGKDPDVVTYDFKNLPADSGAKPTEDQMRPAEHLFRVSVRCQ